MDAADRRARLEAAGRWLREQRTQRGYETGVSFAHAMGIDQSRVSAYERGISEVPEERIPRLASVLRMNEAEVRRGLGLWVPDNEPDERPQRTRDDAVSWLAYDATLEEVEEIARTLLDRVERLRRDAG